MMTFDVAELRAFADALDAELDRCDNDEGNNCSTFDLRLRHYALICWRFRERVRKWAREVFTGRIAFDPEVEQVCIEKGVRLCDRAHDLISLAEKAEDDEDSPCYTLDGKTALKAVLWDLERLIFRWVRPHLSVSPSARIGLPADAAIAAQIQEHLSALPPLPADWQPDDPRLRSRFRAARRR